MPLQQLRRRLVTGVRPGRDFHDLDAEGREDVAVGRIARRRQRHPVADVEGGQEGQQEGARRAGGDHHLPRRHGGAVGPAVMVGDRLAQRRDAQRHGVADLVVAQRRLGRRQHAGRRRGAGLADLEMQHVAMRLLARRGGGHHIHDDEGRHLAAAGDLHDGRVSATVWTGTAPPGRHSRLLA